MTRWAFAPSLWPINDKSKSVLLVVERTYILRKPNIGCVFNVKLKTSSGDWMLLDNSSWSIQVNKKKCTENNNNDNNDDDDDNNNNNNNNNKKRL